MNKETGFVGVLAAVGLPALRTESIHTVTLLQKLHSWWDGLVTGLLI